MKKVFANLLAGMTALRNRYYEPIANDEMCDHEDVHDNLWVINQFNENVLEQLSRLGPENAQFIGVTDNPDDYIAQFQTFCKHEEFEVIDI